MKLSESLRRGIMESFTGGIINKFKIKQRRDTLFFEDISANYIKLCETEGYEKEMEDIGKIWGALAINGLMPEHFKKIPLPLFSKIMGLIWTNLGIMDGVQIKKENDIITLTAKRDSITRIIGKNKFATGCFNGILSAYFNSELYVLKSLQSKESSEYVYEIAHKELFLKGKDKDTYNRLNAMPYMQGYGLKDAIKNNIFQLSDNRIYFRGRSICNSENTIFHIIGNRNILLNEVPKISYNYFSSIVDKNARPEGLLLLLKTLLQTMGWGIVKIIKANRNITIEISNLPCGLQPEKENWTFLIGVISGYVRAIDADLELDGMDLKQSWIRMKFKRKN